MPTATNSSAKSRYLAALHKFEEEHGFLGQLLVRGIDSEDGGDEEEETYLEDDEKSRTEEEMQSLRFVMITQERSDALEQVEDLILGEQAHDSILTFSTSFSYQVLEAYEDFKRELLKHQSKPAQKLNLLFAFTFFLNQHDTWMFDHEVGWGGEKMIADLGNKWKKLWALSNATLGIDQEYTRPAIQCFLEDFKTTVEDIDPCDDPPFEFIFQ